MANAITSSRLLLLIVVVWLAYREPTPWQLLNVPLMIVIFITDGLDGYIARKRHESSVFGALYDIAGDRIVELTMWIVAADLDLVPIWVPLVVIVRDVIVDTIRSAESASKGVVPFALAKSPLATWLVAGRFVRGFYAVVKAHAFCFLLLILPLPAVYPELWRVYGGYLGAVTAVFVNASVLLCLLRGAPVVAEFVAVHLAKRGRN